MILTCPECETQYTVKDGSFDGGERKVRCAKCGHTWMQGPETAEAPSEEPPVEEAAAPEPEAEEAGSEPETTSEKSETPSFRPTPRAAVSDVGFPIEDFHSTSRFFTVDRILTFLIAIILFIGVISALVQYRTEIARSWPPLAGLYAALGVPVNATGMEITNSSWQIESRDGLPMLTVRGEVLNDSATDKAVPRLRFSVRDEKGNELYHWSVVPEVKRLGPGARHRFNTYLPSPPLDAHDIEIRFDLDGS